MLTCLKGTLALLGPNDHSHNGLHNQLFTAPHGANIQYRTLSLALRDVRLRGYRILSVNINCFPASGPVVVFGTERLVLANQP